MTDKEISNDSIKSSIDARGHSQLVFKKDNQWFFYNEVWQLDGPYRSWLEAYWELYRYGQALEGVDAPSYEEVKPVLDALLGVVEDTNV